MNAQRDDQVTKVGDLMKGIHVAMVTSTAAGGALVSRPLSVQDVEFDGSLWFFVDQEAELLQQIVQNPRVNVALEGNGSWVSLSGQARRVDDPAKAQELWNPIAAAWFKAEGSEDTERKDPGPGDLGAVLVEVDGDTAEYWETPGKIATTVSLIKSQITGGGVEAGTNEVVDLP